MRQSARRRISGKWVGAMMLVALSIHLACRGPKQSTANIINPAHAEHTEILPPIELDTPVRFALSSAPDRDFLLALAQDEPMAVLQAALRHGESHIRDYRCVLTKEERVAGTLQSPQTIAVLLRESPRRVLMTWIHNPAKIRRALYIEGRQMDARGKELFEVEPAGAIARALVGTVMTQVHAPKREAVGLGSIDQLGFLSMLRKIVRVSEKANRLGLLSLVFAGEDNIDGRPTFRFVREIRDPARVGKRAAARLVLDLDQEWLVPVSVRCFDDKAGKNLTRSFVFTDVTINPGVPRSYFTLAGEPTNGHAQLAADR